MVCPLGQVMAGLPAWFSASGGERGPSCAACEAALATHMPELVDVHWRLTRLAGGGDLAARFLSTWCPPRYLGGCSVAALSREGAVRLVRNYDLTPDLNEGLLLRSEWTGSPVMGMVEFLWGVSDGVNARGLALALAHGGRPDVAPGFGVTTILRYVLETCGTVAEGLAVLGRVPSHMAYNIVLADRHGATASVELRPGGGLTRRRPAIATNHQADAGIADAGSAAAVSTSSGSLLVGSCRARSTRPPSRRRSTSATTREGSQPSSRPSTIHAPWPSYCAGRRRTGNNHSKLSRRDAGRSPMIPTRRPAARPGQPRPSISPQRFMRRAPSCQRLKRAVSMNGGRRPATGVPTGRAWAPPFTADLGLLSLAVKPW